MIDISFRVNAVPTAQPRQRHALFAGQIRNYIPYKHPVNTFKSSIQLAASQEYQGEPLNIPLSMRIIAIFPRPKNMIWKNKPMPRIPKSTKPDCDNICKSILDALNGLLFRDDSLICELVFEKWIAAGEEQPHVLINLTGF